MRSRQLLRKLQLLSTALLKNRTRTWRCAIVAVVVVDCFNAEHDVQHWSLYNC